MPRYSFQSKLSTLREAAERSVSASSRAPVTERQAEAGRATARVAGHAKGPAPVVAFR